MYTIIFPDQGNDFLPLRTVSMLKLSEKEHFHLLQVISKRVELIIAKFKNHVPNTFIYALEIIDLQVVCIRCYLSQSEWWQYDLIYLFLLIQPAAVEYK